jgi:mRNA degradation ribonuclease J1/J2
VLIDCGVIFDGRGLGVDVVHADWEWLVDRDSVTWSALVLTHGHEDHLGAVSWFLRDFDVPGVRPGVRAGPRQESGSRQHAWHQGPRASIYARWSPGNR